MAFKKYDNLHKERTQLINSGKANFTEPNTLQLKPFEEIVEMQLGCNKCFTLYDFALGSFVKWHLVKEIFGYSNEEFTIGAVNNMDDLNLIHREDISHKLRYDNIIYKIIGGEAKFGIRMDSYCLSLRMIHKDKSVLPVRRRSFIFSANKNQPLSQLDEWEVTNRYKVNHVFPELIVSNKELKDKITEEFYRSNILHLTPKMNGVDLKLDFSNDALRVLHYKIKGESNKSIATKINIQEQSVANTHSKNFKKLRVLFPSDIHENDDLSLEKDKRENINTFREICRRYGFYPVPDSILKLDPQKKRG